MLGRDCLLPGLNALARAHTGDYFADGHRGAALIAGCFLCRRPDIEPGAIALIADAVEREWLGTDLFAPLPDETPEPGLVDHLVAAVVASTDCLRQAGHNVIVPSLALRAIAELPEAVTRTRIDGLRRLVVAFQPWPEPLTGAPVDLCGLDEPAALAEFALTEAVATMERFAGRGQGWTGHLLTHSQAVLDLRRTGHQAAVQPALAGLEHYLRRTRMGPGTGDREMAERAPSGPGPLTERYWRLRAAQPLGLGHCLKYPYALYELLDRVGDSALRRRVEEYAYRLW